MRAETLSSEHFAMWMNQLAYHFPSNPPDPAVWYATACPVAAPPAPTIHAAVGQWRKKVGETYPQVVCEWE
jgi:hypothetical protein